jgi:CDP-glucose 4,6-dehydratase
MRFKAYRGKRVLLTGHTGFKGAWLSLWLLKLGADVTGYALAPQTKPSLFQTLELDRDLRHIVGDIRDFDSLHALVSEYKPDIVFHLAAEAIVRDCYDHPKDAFDVNIGGTVNVLETSRRSSSIGQIVVVTSDKCYENREQQLAFRETDRLGGNDPYSASKAGAELVTNAYTRSFFTTTGPAVASARAGNVIGGGDWANHRLVPDCVRALNRSETLMIRSPHAVRPWQHVLESLSGYLTLGAALMRDPSRHRLESYNFGPDPSYHRTVLELLERAQKNWPELLWEVDSGMTGGKKEATYLRLDCSKAATQLDWHPTLGFDSAVDLTAEWYSAYLAQDSSLRALRDLCDKQIGRFALS